MTSIVNYMTRLYTLKDEATLDEIAAYHLFVRQYAPYVVGWALFQMRQGHNAAAAIQRAVGYFEWHRWVEQMGDDTRCYPEEIPVTLVDITRLWNLAEKMGWQYRLTDLKNTTHYHHPRYANSVLEIPQDPQMAVCNFVTTVFFYTRQPHKVTLTRIIAHMTGDNNG